MEVHGLLDPIIEKMAWLQASSELKCRYRKH
jgi:hypothetical protein